MGSVPKWRPLVVVVDDVSELAEALARSLGEDERLNVVAYSNPLRFLDEGRTRSAAAVILDVHMPYMDGPTLARKLRGDDPSLPILFLTGSPDDLDLQRVRRELASPIDLVSKPCSTIEIRSWLDGLALLPSPWRRRRPRR